MTTSPPPKTFTLAEIHDAARQAARELCVRLKVSPDDEAWWYYDIIVGAFGPDVFYEVTRLAADRFFKP